MLWCAVMEYCIAYIVKILHDILNGERFGVGCTIPQYELGG